MKLSVSQAKGKLTELVRRAESGEDVELTRRGETVARLVPARRAELTPEERKRILDEIIRSARSKRPPGSDPARAADFLYDDETGLPS